MFVIERFDVDFSVVEYGELAFKLPKKILPKSAKEGDLIKIEIKIDESATDLRRREIADLLQFDE